MKITRRELNKINCRKRILKASRKLFSSKGYEETMIEDIAQRAEVSKATVYNYFPSKESLLIGTVDEVCERMYLLSDKELADCKYIGQKLKEVFAEFVRASLDYPSLSRRITYLNSCEDSALYDTRRRIMTLFRDLITAAQGEGVFRADAEPDEMADLLMGVYLIALFQWQRVEQYTPEELNDKLERAFQSVMHLYYA